MKPFAVSALLVWAGAVPAQVPPEPSSRCVQNCGGSTPAAPAKPAAEPRRNRFGRDERAAEFALQEGIDYYNQGDWKNAVRSFEEALNRSPDNDEIKLWLSRAAHHLTPFVLLGVRVTGTAYIVTSDGRRLNGNAMANVALNNRATVFTGPNSQLRVILEDETSFTVGPNSEIVLDDFVYDPDTTVRKFVLRFVKGGLRWVTGKARPRVDPKFETRVINIGKRGTDFEMQVEPDGSGFVRVYEGLVDYMNKQTSRSGTVQPGETLRF